MAQLVRSKAFLFLSVAVLLIAGLGLFVYTGAYNIAADEPHWSVTHRILQSVRDRSIATRSSGLTIPNLADQDLIALGAEHYRAMCSGCHLAPGIADTDMRAGLYPVPPNLTRTSRPPAEQFWIIKHGIKMSGMPAWGKTHDDEAIWGLVAFLRQLPGLSAADYAALGGDPDAPGGKVEESEHRTHDHTKHDHDNPGTTKSDHGNGSGPLATAGSGTSSSAHSDGASHGHANETKRPVKP